MSIQLVRLSFRHECSRKLYLPRAVITLRFIETYPIQLFFSFSRSRPGLEPASMFARARVPPLVFSRLHVFLCVSSSRSLLGFSLSLSFQRHFHEFLWTQILSASRTGSAESLLFVFPRTFRSHSGLSRLVSSHGPLCTKAGTATCLVFRPCGAMDSALDFGSSGCGFESRHGCLNFFFFSS